MARPERILIVEDDDAWQEELRETLEQAGFSVVTAGTRQAALEILAGGLLHLLVLDINLEDEDVSNIDGMEFLRELSAYGISKEIQVILLTARGTEDHMREAFRQHGVNDFIRKQKFDAADFVAEVKEIFDRRMQINFDLAVHWQGGLTPEAAVVNLLLGEERVRRGTPHQALLARELDDLLCRLFHTSRSLLVGPLGGGHSGTGVLLAQPFLAEGGGRPMVVKFGDYRSIQEEWENYERYVHPYLGGGRHTSGHPPRHGPRLGGVVYTLLGAQGDRLSDFGSFYRTASAGEICATLDRLFRDTCGSWYENPGGIEVLELTPYYFEWLGMNPERLEAGLGSLKSVQGKEKLYFQNLADHRSFTNPLAVFPAESLALPTYTTLTHGDLNPSNVLLDEQGLPWLIDFQRTGPGHFLRDAVQLDAAIRLTLLGEDEATLEQRLALEEALARPASFSEVQTVESARAGFEPPVAKAYRTCLHLRRLAGALVAQHTTSDMRQYHAGALFCALNLTRFRSLPTVQREHAMLSACVLTERLGF